MGVFAYAGALSTGTISAANSSSITTESTFTNDQFIGETLRLDSGAASGQSRIIVTNTTDVIHVSPDWDINPTSSYTFRIARTLRSVLGSVSRNVQEIGDRHRAFDGTMRSAIQNRVSRYQLRTIPLSLADASSVESTLTSSTQPVECGGDLFSTGSALTDCDTQLLSTRPRMTGDGNRVSVEFALHESS